MVLFSHSSNMSIMGVSARVVCLWWIRPHAPERPWQKKKGISHFSHWGQTGCETQSRVKLEDHSCQFFHHMGLYKGPQSPFLWDKNTGTISCSASMDWVQPLSAELCSKIMATLPQIHKKLYCSLLQEAKGPAVKDFTCSILLPCRVRTPLKGVKRAAKLDGFEI